MNLPKQVIVSNWDSGTLPDKYKILYFKYLLQKSHTIVWLLLPSFTNRKSKLSLEQFKDLIFKYLQHVSDTEEKDENLSLEEEKQKILKSLNYRLDKTIEAGVDLELLKDIENFRGKE